MTPQQFRDKWSDSKLRERQGAHEHFIDLCQLLGEDTPGSDSTGETYAFEKGALKTGGGDGWADVWKKGCFAWEYKGKGKDLGAALKQLKMYASALENPPLLIVSDMEIIEVHTNWTNRVHETDVFALDDLLDAAKRQKLKAIFSETAVEVFLPGRKRSDLTRDVAQDFVTLADSLRARGHDAEKVAHFVNRMVFCMFAEDVNLLPDKIFTRLLDISLKNPERFVTNAKRLFDLMRTGGDFDLTAIEWFNGGLFNDGEALELTKDDLKIALKAAKQDWSNIDPAIMGTLFERGLDPGKRSQLGAHYTDPEKIMLIVNPVIVEPLTREWETTRADIAAKAEQSKTAKSPGARTTALKAATALKNKFIDRLKEFRVLDPACGAGNFLYLSLKALKDLEHRVNVECDHMGITRSFPVVGPENVKGIEINPFAAELARVSVWIGEIQWMLAHGFDATRNPILKPMETIICHDALLNEDGSEYEWPATDVIVGNPPFLGNKRMIDVLGETYANQLQTRFQDTLSRDVDLVMFWFDKAWRMIEVGSARRSVTCSPSFLQS